MTKRTRRVQSPMPSPKTPPVGRVKRRRVDAPTPERKTPRSRKSAIMEQPDTPSSEESEWVPGSSPPPSTPASRRGTPSGTPVGTPRVVETPRSRRRTERKAPRKSVANDNASESESSESEDSENSESSDGSSSSGSSSSESESELSEESEISGVEEVPVVGNDIRWTGGKILSIRLRSFQNHVDFFLKFHPKMNVISGPNGAGKSSVLLGIQCALGCSAKELCKADMSECINKDASKAIVSIEVANTSTPGGAGAFEPQLYGNRMTITRTLSRKRAGGCTSSYKILNQYGRKVASQKSDVTRVVAHFQLLPHNPCAFVNQDTMKRLMSSTNPKQWYKFYLDATTIGPNEMALEDVWKKLKQIERERERSGRKLDQARSEYEEIKGRSELAQRVATIASEIAVLEGKVAWRAHMDAVEDLKRQTSCLEALQTQQRVLADKITLAQAELEQVETDHQAAGDGRTERVAAVEECKLRESVARRNCSDLTVRVRATKKQIEQLQHRIVDKQRDIAELEQEKATLKAQDSATERLDEAQRVLRNAKQRAEECEEKHKAAVTLKKNVERELRSSKTELTALRQGLERLNQTIRTMQGLIDNMKRRGGKGTKDLVKFNNAIPSLEAAIEKYASRFRQRPVGPIGRFLQLQQQTSRKYVTDWGPVVDSVLGQHYATYIVQNQHDEQLLNQLKRSLRQGDARKISVCCWRGDGSRLYRVPTPRNGQQTVYSVLTFKNDLVHNVLVDLASPELHYLWTAGVPTAKDALRRNRVPHKAVLHASDGSSVCMRGSNLVDRPRTYSNEKKGSTLSQDLEGHIRSKIQELEEKQTEKGMLVGQVDQAREKEQGLRDELNKATSQEASCEENLKSARDKVSRQQRIYEDLESSVDVGTAVKDKDDEIAEVEREVQRATAEQRKLRDEAQGLKSQVVEREKHQREAADAVLAAQDALDRYNEQEIAPKALRLRTLREWISKRKHKMRKVEALMPGSIETRDDLAAQVEKLRAEAAVLTGTPMEPQESSKQLLRQLSKAQKEKEVASKELGDNAKELIEECERRGRQFSKWETAYKSINKNFQATGKAYNMRVTRFKQLAGKAKVTVNTSFGVNMGFRQSGGTVKINDEEQTMAFTFQAHKGDSNGDSGGDGAAGGESKEAGSSATSAAKTMSGGERTYCGVALLLALSKVFDTPIRALDECDVFLCPENRLYVYGLLLQNAAQSSCQYFVLTPQDLEPLRRMDRWTDETRYHVLADPRIRQQLNNQESSMEH